MNFRQLRPVGNRVPLPSLSDLRWTARDAVTDALHEAAVSFSSSSSAQPRGFFWYGSATAALAMALRAAANARKVMQPEVIIPAFACPDIVAAAVHAGVQPVLADFAPDTVHLDPSDVRAALSPRTVAVISVRLLGLPGNSTVLKKVLGPDGPVVIEDCAHVLPAEALRTDADAVILSFGRGKPVSLRAGGVIVTNTGTELHAHCAASPVHRHSWFDAAMHASCAALYNVAMTPQAYWFLTQVCGVDVDAIAYRPLRSVNGFPAFLARLLPAALQRDHANCARLALQYARMLKSIGGPWSNIGSSAGQDHPANQVLPTLDAPTLWRYPLLLSTREHRDGLFDRLWRAGLGPSRLYRRTLAEMSGTAVHVVERPHPNARALASRLLTLPLHSDVTQHDIRHIRAVFETFAATVPDSISGELRTSCT